jgi:hypothetical protein
MHGYSKDKCRRVESGGQSLPEEAEGLPEAFRRGNRRKAETGPPAKPENRRNAADLKAARGKRIV